MYVSNMLFDYPTCFIVYNMLIVLDHTSIHRILNRIMDTYWGVPSDRMKWILLKVMLLMLFR